MAKPKIAGKSAKPVNNSSSNEDQEDLDIADEQFIVSKKATVEKPAKVTSPRYLGRGPPTKTKSNRKLDSQKQSLL